MIEIGNTYTQRISHQKYLPVERNQIKVRTIYLTTFRIYIHGPIRITYTIS